MLIPPTLHYIQKLSNKNTRPTFKRSINGHRYLLGSICSLRPVTNVVPNFIYAAHEQKKIILTSFETPKTLIPKAIILFVESNAKFWSLKIR